MKRIPALDRRPPVLRSTHRELQEYQVFLIQGMESKLFSLPTLFNLCTFPNTTQTVCELCTSIYNCIHRAPPLLSARDKSRIRYRFVIFRRGRRH